MLILRVLVTVTLVFSTVYASDVPSFQWLSERSVESGIQLLKINFPDGSDDVVQLRHFDSFPTFDKGHCIFDGFLVKEPEVYATVTGGCPNDKNFEIQFRSSKLNHYMFKVEDGVANPLLSPFSETEKDRFGRIVKKVNDIALKVPKRDGGINITPKDEEPPILTDPPILNKNLNITPKALPSTLVMNVAMYYDAAFKQRFSQDSIKIMREVVAQAQNWYYHSSLTTRIRLNVVSETEVTDTLEANEDRLRLVGKYPKDSNIHENAFLTSQGDQSGVVGIAWVGTVCESELAWRTSVNEYFRSSAQTGQVVAHEIGHNLGMSHDFGSSTSVPRFDSAKNPCSKVGGVMDYYGNVSKWSTCSVEDFTRYYNGEGGANGFCMQQDGQITTPAPSTTTTTRPPTTTTTRPPTTTTITTRPPTTTFTRPPSSSTTVPPSTTRPPTTTTTNRPPPSTTSRPSSSTTSRPSTTTSRPGSDCTCGVFGNRIVNGFAASQNAYPYQVGLVPSFSVQPFCGGSIISRNFILTAAHCTAGESASDIRVSVGDHNYQANDGEQIIRVKNIINHPNYDSETQDNDFALLELETPITISRKAGVICLPPDNAPNFVGTKFTISGWGRTSSGGKQSPILLAAYVFGISNAACQKAGYGSSITDNMICATTDKIDTDTCQGDSGGPLAANVNGKTTLVGVTSFGVGCAQAPYPGVYARVSAQKAWILSTTDAGKCQN